MNDAQIFQLFGLAYLAMGIGFLLNPQSLQKLLTGFRGNPPIFFVMGIFTLVIGFLLVTFHNHWNCSWSVIITVFGWIALIKGLTILILPNVFDKIILWYENKLAILKFYPITVIALGIFFAILGFFVV